MTLNKDKLHPYILKDSIEERFVLCSPIIEVGCGNGHFLVSEAQHVSQRIFLGCEIKWKRVYKTASKIFQQQLDNAFVFYGRGEDLLAQFGRESIGGFHLNFPDPWWKKKYYKRRFFYLQQDVDTLVYKLVLGAAIHLVTDHEAYFKHVFSMLLYNSQLTLENHKHIEEGSLMSPVETIFAKKWEQENRKIYSTKFVKISNQG